eukprot:Skav200655  [mRNA]  locus=scaffold2539:170217:170588:- [translate_table: standard]
MQSSRSLAFEGKSALRPPAGRKQMHTSGNQRRGHPWDISAEILPERRCWHCSHWLPSSYLLEQQEVAALAGSMEPSEVLGLDSALHSAASAWGSAAPVASWAACALAARASLAANVPASSCSS